MRFKKTGITMLATGAAIFIASWISPDKNELPLPPKSNNILVISQENDIAQILTDSNDENKKFQYLMADPKDDSWKLDFIRNLNPLLYIQIEQKSLPHKNDNFVVYYSSANEENTKSLDIACKIAQEMSTLGFLPYKTNNFEPEECSNGQFIYDFPQHPVLRQSQAPTTLLEYDAKAKHRNALREPGITEAIDTAVTKHLEETYNNPSLLERFTLW